MHILKEYIKLWSVEKEAEVGLSTIEQKGGYCWLFLVTKKDKKYDKLQNEGMKKGELISV